MTGPAAPPARTGWRVSRSFEPKAGIVASVMPKLLSPRMAVTSPPTTPSKLAKPAASNGLLPHS